MLFASAVVAALALVASVRADVDESDVLVLTTANFDETVSSNEFVLVEFYAPWCGHCKKLVPEYAKAATALKDTGIKLAKVDATVETDLGSKFEVRGYPTLKFFRSGSPVDYNGPRESAGIVAWLKKKSGPASKQLAAGDVDAFVAESKPCVVGSFKGERDSDAYTAFLAAAKDGALDDFQFADVAGADADEVALYTAHADKQVFSGEGDLKEFVQSNGYPLVDKLPEAWERYSKTGNTLAILFVDLAADNKEVLAAATKAAEAVKGKFSFSYADGVRFKQQIERMGAAADSLPVIAAMKLNGKSNYPYAGELTADALSAWAQGIVDGSIQPVMKSEAIPESNDGGVTVVVGKQFNELVLDASKDVLLEIYAPWCGHCKSLAPVWEKLGEAYKSKESVVIAKIDGTANDFDVEYRGFPTIKFFPAGSDSLDDMQDYEGGRTYDDFVKFLGENAKDGKLDDTAAAADADAGKKKDEL